MAWERTGFTLLLLLIQSILVGLKLDGVIESSWWAVFVPAYVWVAVFAIVVALALYNLNSGYSYKQWMSAWRAAYFCITVAIVIVFVVLTAVRAQGNTDVQWSVVFIPIYIYLALLLLVIVYQGVQHSRGNVRLAPLDALPGITAWLQWFWLINVFVWCGILIVLLAVKLDGGLNGWNYWAVLSPLWVLLITLALLFISSIPFIVVKQLEVDSWKLIFYVTAYVASVLFLIFLILRADSTVDWKWSVVFIPLYITQAVLLLYVTLEWLLEPSMASEDDVDFVLSSGGEEAIL